MENRDWINDYKALKLISPANPFAVPEGYFDDLSERIVSLKNITGLKAEVRSGGFTVPENYFDELAANIQSRINIEAALNIETHGFAVPEGYFDELSENIQSRINVESVLNTADAGFTTPQGYFDNLQEQINSRIFVEEALSEPAFTVPEGYFAKLNNDILAKTVNANSVNTQGAIVRKMFASTAFKYATAACFALFLGGGILISELAGSKDDHRRSYLHKELSGVSIDDIKDYLQQNVDAGDTQQTVVTEGTPVDDAKLRDALQDALDTAK